MTQREICEWIVEHGGCCAAMAHLGTFVSCKGFWHCVNEGTACSLAEGEFCCNNFSSSKEAAEAWLEAHKEDV